MLKNSSRLFIAWQQEAAAPQSLYARSLWFAPDFWYGLSPALFPTHSSGLSRSLLGHHRCESVLPCTHHTSLCLPFCPVNSPSAFNGPSLHQPFQGVFPSLLTRWQASLGTGFVGLLPPPCYLPAWPWKRWKRNLLLSWPRLSLPDQHLAVWFNRYFSALLLGTF